jgi:glucose-1-phosphate adenylyltransferase
MKDLIAVILGGGAGTRLHPLTAQRSKPAVPLAGKYRLIDIPVSNCINAGLNRIFVLTQFNSASLNRHIGNTYQFDRFRRGFVTILAAEQTPSSTDWFQGTADAVRRSRSHLDTHPHSHVLILSGDQLYTMDYRKLMRHHEESGAEITIATIPVTAEEAPAFGILKTDDQGHITEFHEKPPLTDLEGKDSPVSSEMESEGRIYLASMGIYVFNRDAMRETLDAHPDEHDFGREIIPRALRDRRVVSYPFTGYWSDIGTVGSFYEANLMLASNLPAFDMYNPEMPIYTNARMLPPAKVQASTVTQSLIGEASVIVDSNIEESVIGIRSYIGRNVTIRRSIIMGADYYPWQAPAVAGMSRSQPGVGDDSVIEGAIIDRNVSIGKNCVIRNSSGVQEGESDYFVIRDGVVVVPKGITVPDGTVI